MNDQSLTAQLEKKKQLLSRKENRKHRVPADVYHQKTSGENVGDLVYGANDGIITTFAVVAGASGASLAPLAVIALGLANLLADGLSMGLGNYISNKSEREYQQAQREKELWEVEHLPAVEAHEVREIVERWGLDRELAQQVTDRIVNNREAWVDIMMREELGILEEQAADPVKHGLATFAAFVVAGLTPLLPFLIPGLAGPKLLWATILAALTLFAVGALRSRVSVVSWLKGGLEMLAIGASAAGVAYGIGWVVERLFGAG